MTVKPSSTAFEGDERGLEGVGGPSLILGQYVKLSNPRTSRPMDGPTDGWTDEQMDQRTNADGPTDRATSR